MTSFCKIERHWSGDGSLCFVALKSQLINFAGNNKSQLIAKLEGLVKLVIKVKMVRSIDTCRKIMLSFGL